KELSSRGRAAPRALGGGGGAGRCAERSPCCAGGCSDGVGCCPVLGAGCPALGAESSLCAGGSCAGIANGTRPSASATAHIRIFVIVHLVTALLQITCEPKPHVLQRLARVRASHEPQILFRGA